MAARCRTCSVTVTLLAARAVEDDVDGLRRQIASRVLESNAVLVVPRASSSAAYQALAFAAARIQGTIAPCAMREIPVRHDQLGVELPLGAEAGADRAGAVRGVEGEVARLDLVKPDHAVHGQENFSEKTICLAVDDLRLGDAARRSSARSPATR